MNDKRVRQNKILELIARGPVRTQQELADLLMEKEIETTQSTLSKDIKELGLIKAPDQDGGVRYCAPTQASSPHRQDILQRELLDFMTGCDSAGNLLVLKTTAGNASGVCAAIDSMKWPEVVGTVAGDDTIFIACKTPVQARDLQERIEGIGNGTGVKSG
jgi:transcriptional regulator of arginine metabolism